VTISTRRYGGQSPDERRRQRRQQFIDAATDMIASQGVGSLKVRAVCARAGLNDRYFYESFADCDALLVAGFEDQFAQALATLLGAVAQSPPQPRPRTRAVVEAAFDFIDDDSRRPRLVVELASAEALKGHRRQLIQTLARVMVDQARELLGEQVSQDLNVTLASLTVMSGLLELGAMWFQGDIDADRDQLIEFMIAMILTTADITTALERELTPN
jgi:AcrR family transcriptional regulator